MWRMSLGFVALAGLFVSVARADDAALEGIYGAGVEAYYTGNYVQAFNMLNGAVQAGSHDPRVYYFRGLAQANLGRTPDAERDFQQGAALETSNTASVVDVGRSLERVQGPTRLLLERYRSAARLQAAAQRARERFLRYGNAPAALPAQQQTVGPPAAQPAATQPAAPAAKPAAENPFGEAPAGAAKPAAEDPFATPAKPAAEDPFATPPK